MGGDDEDRLFDVDGVAPRIARRPKRSRARDKTGTIEAREMGGWTLNKLEVLTAYFKMYRRVAGGGTYIDAFAGEGHATVRGKVINGSPLRAVEEGAFRQLHFFELNRGKHQRLGQAVAGLTESQQQRCHLWPKPADSNAAIPELLASGDVPVDKPCFAFLDPNSTELGWDLVTALAGYKSYEPPGPGERTPRHCKVELWVLLNTHQALLRLLPKNRAKYPTPPFAHKLDFVMGDRDAWLDLWTTPTASSSALADRYAERLHSVLGYRATHAQAVRDPETDAIVYFMIHASDHPNAETIMRSAKRSRMADEDPFPGWRGIGKPDAETTED